MGTNGIETSYDLVVIGGGSAGLTAATIGGKVCAKTLLVDNVALGGDCLHFGCVPSKALIKAAKVAHTVRNAARFGVNVEASSVDFGRAMDYVAERIAKVGEHDSPEAMGAKGVEVAFGGAEFVDRNHLRVGDRVVESKATIIAVGSKAKAPEITGLETAGYIDHVSLFRLRTLPKRLVVIGGGPIGLEMGQALARFGSRVTILESGPRLLKRDDEGLSDLLRQHLSEEMTIHCEAKVVEVSTRHGSKVVTYEREGVREEVECDEILVAVGRAPALKGLGLEKAGVEWNDRGIIVDSTLATTAKGVWACGDCTGGFQFTHWAEAQARVAARNALFRGAKKMSDSPVPWTTFTDPELAHVGLTEKQANASGASVEVYRFPYERLDRAVTDGETRGLAKVICDRNGKILGASILGHSAGEAITEVVLAMDNGIALSKLTQSIHVYPTMNRVIRRLGDERFLNHGVSQWTTKLFGRFRQECATDPREMG